MPTFKKNTSPAMKRSGFKMKSGNTPLFKHMASSPSPITSPANLNNFGIGKGTSPLEQSVESNPGDPWSYRKTDEGKWETRKHGRGDWIIATGNAEADIEKKYGSQITATETDTKTKDAKTDFAKGTLNPEGSPEGTVTTEDASYAPGHAPKGSVSFYPEAKTGAKAAKLGAAGRNLAEIFMGGIHNVYGNPAQKSKTTEFDEEKAYKRWAKEKSDKETMTIAQQIIADDNKRKKEALKEKK